jgi:hypothetical protein
LSLEDGLHEALADGRSADAEAVRVLLASLREQLGADSFYVFWISGGATRPPGGGRPRTLLAFLTADAALAFAQRNRLIADRPRLRRLSLLQLVLATLREPAILAILFVAEHEEQAHLAGQLPQGLRIARADLLRSLNPGM